MIRNFFSCIVSLRAVKTDRFIKRLFEIDGKREINASLKVYIYIYIYCISGYDRYEARLCSRRSVSIPRMKNTWAGTVCKNGNSVVKYRGNLTFTM